MKILHNVFPELNIFILHLNAFCFFVESEAFIQSLLNEQLWDDYLQTEYKLKIPQNNILSKIHIVSLVGVIKNLFNLSRIQVSRSLWNLYRKKNIPTSRQFFLFHMSF